jgi:hypothetical protein
MDATGVSALTRLTATQERKSLTEQRHRLTAKLQRYLTASSEQMNSATEDAEREHKRRLHTSQLKHIG